MNLLRYYYGVLAYQFWEFKLLIPLSQSENVFWTDLKIKLNSFSLWFCILIKMASMFLLRVIVADKSTVSICNKQLKGVVIPKILAVIRNIWKSTFRIMDNSRIIVKVVVISSHKEMVLNFKRNCNRFLKFQKNKNRFKPLNSFC